MINLNLNISNIKNLKSVPNKGNQISFGQTRKDEFVKTERENVSIQDDCYEQVNPNFDVNRIMQRCEKKIQHLPTAMKCCLYDIYNYLDQYFLIKEFIDMFNNDKALLDRIIKNNDERVYERLYAPEMKAINDTQPLCESYLAKDINKQDFNKEIESIVSNYANQESQLSEVIAN